MTLFSKPLSNGSPPAKKGVPSQFKVKSSPNPKGSAVKILGDQATEIKIGFVAGDANDSGNYAYFVTTNNSGRLPWADKLFYDDLKKFDGVARSLGFYPVPFRLFRENIMQVNQNGYFMRVYVRFTDDERASNPDDLCNYIAEHLNGNNDLQAHQRVTVNRSTYLVSLTSVWSDILGDGEQPLYLMRQLHDNVDTDFGPANLSVVHTYWRPNDFPIAAARALGLPDTEVRGAVRIAGADGADAGVDDDVEANDETGTE